MIPKCSPDPVAALANATLFSQSLGLKVGNEGEVQTRLPVINASGSACVGNKIHVGVQFKFCHVIHYTDCRGSL